MNTDPSIWQNEINLIKRRAQSLTSQDDLIAFYGSSSIRLWTDISSDLQPHHIINLGFGGSSYYWCNHFFNDVFESLQPTRVVLYAGDNDLGSETSEDQIMDHLNSLMQKISQETSADISIISVKPSPERLYLRDKIESLNQRIVSLLDESVGDFIDVYSAMLNDNGSYRPELFLEDQLHMNEGGYAIWKKVISQYLNQLAEA